jgi:hypothetical protein
MISILEPTKTTRIVYFDDCGLISQITGRVDEDNTNTSANFEIDDILDFIEGNKKFSDYAVTRTDNPLIFEIVKKKANLRHRNVNNQVSKIELLEDADINVEINANGIKFSASETLIKKSNVRKNQRVAIAGTDKHPFWLTHKDRPDFIISTVLVDLSDLLSGEIITINYEHKYEVSIYTKRYFDTYSLRRTY